MESARGVGVTVGEPGFLNPPTVEVGVGDFDGVRVPETLGLPDFVATDGVSVSSEIVTVGEAVMAKDGVLVGVGDRFAVLAVKN